MKRRALRSPLCRYLPRYVEGTPIDLALYSRAAEERHRDVPEGAVNELRAVYFRRVAGDRL